MAKKVSILKHLMLMLVASGLILVGIMWGLHLYTRHQTNIQVPTLVGLDMAEAARVLEQTGLRYEVVDSVYDGSKPSGTVAEVIPVAGAQVKPGRIVFIKSYSRSPMRYALPYVKDMSERQARAILRGMGFAHIEERTVPGEYIGLCAGLESRDGRPYEAGELVAKETPIVMLVTGSVQDSISIDDLIDMSEADTAGTTTQSDEPATNPEEWW